MKMRFVYFCFCAAFNLLIKKKKDIKSRFSEQLKQKQRCPTDNKSETRRMTGRRRRRVAPEVSKRLEQQALQPRLNHLVVDYI